MIASFYVGDTLADRLYKSGAFMSENDRKCSFGIFSRESVGI